MKELDNTLDNLDKRGVLVLLTLLGQRAMTLLMEEPDLKKKLDDLNKPSETSPLIVSPKLLLPNRAFDKKI